jgi:Tfp pilus assembly protein PilV
METQLDTQSAVEHDVPCRDAGYSITEVLVAVVLMSVAIIPLLLASIVTIKTSSQVRTAAKVETILANAADRVNRAGESCDYDVFVEAAALAQGWESSQAVAQYQYYEPAELPTSSGTWHDGACPGAIRPNGLAQRVTITVTSPDGSVHRTLEVVKSDV